MMYLIALLLDEMIAASSDCNLPLVVRRFLNDLHLPQDEEA